LNSLSDDITAHLFIIWIAEDELKQATHLRRQGVHESIALGLRQLEKSRTNRFVLDTMKQFKKRGVQGKPGGAQHFFKLEAKRRPRFKGCVGCREALKKNLAQKQREQRLKGRRFSTWHSWHREQSWSISRAWTVEFYVISPGFGTVPV
jgi:hypothetical protein